MSNALPNAAPDRNTAPSVQQVADFLAQYAPPALAAEWDNVGLLVGDGASPAPRIMTCLTITPASAQEAIDEAASLIVAHHPLPFRPLKQITTSSTTGRLLWNLIRAGISIYSPHTAFDSTLEGINQLWAARLGLAQIAPLELVAAGPAGAGIGRIGNLPEPQPLEKIALQITKMLDIPAVQVVGRPAAPISRIAIGCGSAGSMLSLAQRAQCDLFLTGEASFHTCLEAEALGIAMILTGHYASERFGVEHLAQALSEQFPASQIWPSRRERDPLGWFASP